MHRIFVVGFDSQRKKRLLAGLDQAGHSAVSVIDLGTWLEREWQDGSLIVVLDVGPVMTHLSESAVPIVVAPSGVSEQTVLALVDSALGSRPTAEPLRYEDTIVRELLATSPDHISFKDLNGRFVRISASLVPVFGLDRPEDAIGKSDFDFYPEEQARAFFEEEQCMIRGGPPVINRLADYLHPDGSVVRGLVTKMPLRDAEGTVIGTYGVARNVTELLEAESRIRALLDEKEILLREIHHRVKNDFSLIRSLLLLEASQSPHNEVVAALRDAASRVAVMARTYDQINVRGNPASVAVRPLVEELFRDGVEAAAVPLSVHTSIDEVEAPPRVAVTLGIVLNELFTNAMKHAFDRVDEPILTVTMRCCDEGRLAVRVADNGRGFGATVLAGAKRGHGLAIVEALVGQHRGALELMNDQGAVVEFSLHAG